MKNHFYYSIARRTIIQTLDMFNDIWIGRYDTGSGELLKYIQVPLKFAPKTKQFYFVEKRDDAGNLIRDKIVPIMAMYLVDIPHNPNRKVNQRHRITSSRTSTDITQFYNLIPYDFTFELQIAAQYMTDILQIIEQVLPFFNPESFVRVTIPDLGITQSGCPSGAIPPLDLKMLYEGSSPDISVEMGEEDYRVLLWTMTFRVEGYLSRPAITSKLVRKVVNKLYTSDDAWAHQDDTTTQLISGVGHDSEEVLTLATSGVKYDEDARILYKYEIFGDEDE